MEYSLGETIKQLRKQRSLTQTELGGEQFSKSYVSAVEGGKILPSYEAVRYFATQLEQSQEHFERLLLETTQAQQTSLQPAPMASIAEEQNDQEVIALLDLLLQGREAFALNHPMLNPTGDSTASQQKYALYSFLRGLQMQKQGETQSTLSAFEYALALAPEKYQALILSEMGLYFSIQGANETALHYYRRSLQQLSQDVDKDSDLRLRIELRAGHSYRALNDYNSASVHYEQARKLLRSSHNMQIAAELYLGLGYCTYAALYQKALPLEIIAENKNAERTFRQALSYLVQGRTLYQVGSNRTGAIQARLIQAMILLDFSRWQQESTRQTGPQHVGERNNFITTTLLDEVEEQCRQIMLETREDTTAESKRSLYIAISYLTSSHLQRATIARHNNYVDTAQRERLLALELCKQTLETLPKEQHLHLLLEQVQKLSIATLHTPYASLFRLPDPEKYSDFVRENPQLQAELFFVAGEIAEELAQEASSLAFQRDCYDSADECFERALSAANHAQQEQQQDVHHTARFYRRYIELLQRRDASEERNDSLLKVLAAFKGLLALVQRQ